MAQTYAGAVGSATAQGLLTAVWIASGELSEGKRRLARAGAAAAVATVGWFTSDRDTDAGDHEAPDDPSKPVDRRRVAVVVAASALSIGMIAGRRQLEKRWLARLTRAGHEHPHRALALRLGLLSVAATLPGKLLAVHEARTPVDLDRG